MWEVRGGYVYNTLSAVLPGTPRVPRAVLGTLFVLESIAWKMKTAKVSHVESTKDGIDIKNARDTLTRPGAF